MTKEMTDAEWLRYYGSDAFHRDGYSRDRLLSIAAKLEQQADLCSSVKKQANTLPLDGLTDAVRQEVWKAQYMFNGATAEQANELALRRVNDDKQRHQDIIAYQAMRCSINKSVAVEAANTLPLDEVPEGYEWAVCKSYMPNGDIFYFAAVDKPDVDMKDRQHSAATTPAEALRAAIAKVKP